MQHRQDIGIFLPQPLQGSLKRRRVGQYRCQRDMHFAGRFGFQVFQRLMRIGQRVQQARAMAAETAAGIGGRQAARTAVEQLHPVQRFQPRNMLADRRRRHSQRSGGGVHAAVFEHGGKHNQRFGVLHFRLLY